MGKEKSIHKQIANAIKAKGLQKLRWYCELCKKQCRDANGFKCHLTSEGHKRQIMLFGQSPDKFVEDFSAQFLVRRPGQGLREVLRCFAGFRRAPWSPSHPIPEPIRRRTSSTSCGARTRTRGCTRTRSTRRSSRTATTCT